ncbi:MAG: DUF935 family protein [Rhodocyclaceae bacterium]|nr:DUF935 family protein [Rhodocyclaceae bacterium]
MTAKGIWVSDRQFIRFAEPGTKLTDQIATRDRSVDYLGLGMVLPNPDPILKAKGQDIRVYRDLRSDAHVGGCVRRRKSAVKALEWGLDRGKAKSRVAKNIEAIFADLNLERIIGEILEAPMYGYQPMEIMLQKVGGLVVPVDLVGKPPEWFVFGLNNELRFRTKARPFEGEVLPDRKFIVARQDATYANPYGFPDLSMCFWPIVFKKGGVKFWVNFAEKYGTPWAIGKLPRGTPQKDIDDLADQLDAMIQDAVAVIPDDGSVELVEAAGKSASADLYERLVMYCRSEVSIALTGTNQTVEANSNRASATAGLEVADDLRDGDAGIVAEVMNQLIRWTCETNWSGGERPVFSLWDQHAQDVTQANRDETVSKSGAKFTNAYWMRAYRYQDGDLAPEAPSAPLPAGVQFAEGEADQTPIDPLADQLAAEAAPALDALLMQVRNLVERAESLDALRDALLAAYADLPADQLARVMSLGFAVADMAGRADVADH